VNLARGNFYHHFKTKDDILDAVIEARIVRTQAMLDEWEAQGSDPRQRVLLFVDILVRNEAKIPQYGCPVEFKRRRTPKPTQSTKKSRSNQRVHRFSRVRKSS
jgi:AcrR family transcriptional regulator